MIISLIYDIVLFCFQTRVHFNLEDVGFLIQDLLGDYYKPYYLTNPSFRHLGDEAGTDYTAPGEHTQTEQMIGAMALGTSMGN